MRTIKEIKKQENRTSLNFIFSCALCIIFMVLGYVIVDYSILVSIISFIFSVLIMIFKLPFFGNKLTEEEEMKFIIYNHRQRKQEQQQNWNKRKELIKQINKELNEEGLK